MSHFSLTTSNWVCLGVGAALSYGASRLWRVFGRLAQARQAHMMMKMGSGGGQASDLLPGDIRAAIQASPVVQQPRAGKSYHGMTVQWRVTFESAFASGVFTVRLMCWDRGNFPWVVCDVRRGRYPQMEGMLKHTPFWISGRITKIEGDQIFLNKVQLGFED